jgi:5-carboxymethyl-2-hydroxymuconate isomerase
MPHIIIEHSKDILSDNLSDFLPKIPQEMEKIEGGNFSLEACKLRSFSFENYFVGSKNQQNSSFFHATIKILEGRNAQVKKNLAQNISRICQEFLKLQNISKERVDLSVDIVDMDKETYQKITL